jgi:hypothetical protein
MNPFFEHQKIDVGRGTPSCSRTTSSYSTSTGFMIRSMRFELQTEEIKSYYASLAGKYFPRQPMMFTSL